MAEGRQNAVGWKEESAGNRIEVERQTLVDLHTLRTTQDSEEPDVRSMSESEWSFTFLDWANNAV